MQPASRVPITPRDSGIFDAVSGGGNMPSRVSQREAARLDPSMCLVAGSQRKAEAAEPLRQRNDPNQSSVSGGVFGNCAVPLQSARGPSARNVSTRPW